MRKNETILKIRSPSAGFGGQVKTLTLKVYDYVGEANVFYAALASCLLIFPPALLLWANKRFLFKAV